MAQPTMDSDEAAFLTALKNEIIVAITANTAAINSAAMAAQIAATAAASAFDLMVITTAKTVEEAAHRNGRW